MIEGPLEKALLSIASLPDDWHGAGTLPIPVLRAIVRHAGARPVRRSVETGTGKSTLLLSHLSDHHSVYSISDGDSLAQVRSSPLLRQATTHFVAGPTQRTLPTADFAEPLQLALLDGPHAYPFPELEYYFIYPHLATDALLIVDDIHIPTVQHLFRFLAEDAMYSLLEVVGTTAFLRRTAAPTFDPCGDGWTDQRYNIKRFPVGPLGVQARELLKRVLPPAYVQAIKRRLST